MLEPKKGKIVPFLLLVALIAACSLWLIPKWQAPKVYDCFVFHNELELLEIRLNEMYDHVDKFVIVEANETFSGKPKNLNFEANKELFQRFSDKIIYIPVSDHIEDAAQREQFLRDQVMKGLTDCKSYDIILLSDVNEIVRSEKLVDIASTLFGEKADLIICEQTMYSGYLNRLQSKKDRWKGTTAVRYKDLKRISPSKIRKLREKKPEILKSAKIKQALSLPNSGWHFTCMGDQSEVKNPDNISLLIKRYPLVAIDETFPKFVRENQEYLKKKGLLDD